jgi:D-ala D-ala ligase C-terminus
MENEKKTGLLCVSSFHKGEDFLLRARAENCNVFLLTSDTLQGEWNPACFDEVFYAQEQPEGKGHWNMGDVIAGMAWIMRERKIDRVVALDDFDVEKAAQLREEFRISGMGQTTARYFRDKLAMRIRAQEAGIKVPAFSALFNNREINQYTERVSAPWLVKPRSEASATGITKIHSADELWQHLDALGDRRHGYLIEQFRPGDVYHVDALSLDGKVIFVRGSKYLATPMDVAHGGGIFRSMVVDFEGPEDLALKNANELVLKAFGMQFSATHTEFIRDRETGDYIFLETSSRVGGANLAEMVYYSSDINIWSEWAVIEKAMAENTKYKLPKVAKRYAGIIVSLARMEWPDSSVFNDPEVVWRMHRQYHIGVIVASDSAERVRHLLDQYALKVQSDFHASAPLPDRSV